jgi:hypothetical protein
MVEEMGERANEECVREAARQLGWWMGNLGDFCPNHHPRRVVH